MSAPQLPLPVHQETKFSTPSTPLDELEALASYVSLEDAAAHPSAEDLPPHSNTRLWKVGITHQPPSASLPPDVAVDMSMELSIQCTDAHQSPPSKAGRRRSHSPTPPPQSNAVRTAYYTWWNFVPVFLCHTFRKTANLYFLAIGLLQIIPPISPTNGVPLQFLPLSIVVLVDGIFAAIEDYHRHRADQEMNDTLCYRYNVTTCAFDAVAWKDLVVGDLLQLHDNEVAPADVVVVATHGRVAGCYIETKSLDGETNLKLREPLLQDSFAVSEPDIGTVLDGLDFVDDELPTPNIHVYRGAVHCSTPNLDDVVTVPIGVQHTVWRGCKIRNTKRVWGVVIHVGAATKIMQGLNQRVMKQSAIEIITDAQVLVLVALLVVLCVIGASADTIWIKAPVPEYLGDFAPASPFITSFAYFFITMAAVVPISLYVSVTAVKNVQGYFMARDIHMFDEERGLPMQARNKALNEQLGHITHIFSDKTGTITCNKMVFRKCSIRGVSYSTPSIGWTAADQPRPSSTDSTDDDERRCDEPESNAHFEDPCINADMDGASGPDQANAIRAFFTHLALSHCVLIDANHSFAASSPDELALVSAAKYFGFAFVERKPGAVVLDLVNGGGTQEYQVLSVFEFTSARKRMSVVVKPRSADDHVLLLCKGADSVLYPRLQRDAWVDETQTQLQGFASEGFRTLVIASKTVAVAQWEQFHTQYQHAHMHNPELNERLQDSMEQDLTLLGVTAIEDRLQDGVPDTLELLSKAGIALWVLTGDMEETAVNVAFACSLMTNDTERYMINAKTCPTRMCLLHKLDDLYNRIMHSAALNAKDIAVVIDGATLSLLLHGDDKLTDDALHFLRVALLCRVVVACRCSPTQKARLVELVQRNCADARTLAIGDGANDVPMLRAAHVGVGIAGEEGRQAVNSSDFAIGQFRFLARLVLVHGRWNYNRVAHLILFTYYKNIVYCMSMFWYMLAYSAYSGTLVYAVFVQQGYNLFFTALPVIALAVLDQDVPADVAMAVPQLYNLSHRKIFDHTRFWKWVVMGVVDSVLLLYVVTLAGGLVDPTGATTTLLTLGDLGWTALCVYMNVRIMLLVTTWNVYMVGSILISLAFLVGFQLAIDVLWLQDPTTEAPFWWLMGFPTTWLIQLLVVGGLVLKDVWFAAYQRTFHPSTLDLAQIAAHATTATRGAAALGRAIEFPRDKWILPHLHNLRDTLDTDVAGPTDDMRQRERHHGFAFGQPVNVMRWLAKRASPRPRWNTEFLQFVLATDAAVYENERYQPFVGFGHSFPGHLLPSDRGHWSNEDGDLSTNHDISTALLKVDVGGAACDQDGWEYAWDFSQFPRGMCQRRLALVRRRRWVVRDPPTLE